MALIRFLSAGAAMVLLGLALPALAQEAGGRKGSLVAMAGVLGESQALRELCEGNKDPYWRSRMLRLMSVEGVEGPAAASLTAAFNAAYARARTEHIACGPESRRAEADAATRGQELAAALAVPVADAEPAPAEAPAIAEPPAPR